MNTKTESLKTRCQVIRGRLSDFFHDRLGAMATGEVQGHLLACQDCSEAYGELITREIESGVEPLRTPPHIPPTGWYDAYLRGYSGQFGILWESLRNALQSADSQLKEWAQKQIEQFGTRLGQLFIPPPSPAAVVRVRGGTPVRSRLNLVADVFSPAWKPTGQTVSFTVEEMPHITSDHRFRLLLRTQIAGYDGQSVICTLALPEMLPVSFSGTLKSIPGTGAWSVEIDQKGIPCAAGNISVKQIRLAVVITVA